MKKVLLFAVLCVVGITVKALPPMVTNTTSCNLTITGFCYDPNTCQQVGLPCGQVTVLAAPSPAVNLPVCGCGANKQAYRVCCAPGDCVKVGDGTSACSDLPNSVTFVACPCATSVHVSVSATGDMTITP